MAKGNRREDGTLHLSVVRSRSPKKQSKYWKQRTQWAEATEKESRIWNGEELQDRLGGISYAQAGERLEKIAEAAGWVVFRDKCGRVHAIAKRKARENGKRS